MAESLIILTTIQATTQLVEQAFRILGRLRRAHQRQKGLVDVLHRHENELDSIKTIIGVIDDEEELQTPSVATELFRLKEVQTRLAKFLEELDPKQKNKINQFAHQLVHGSSEERALGVIMGELAQVKAMLLLRIQVTSVGVMRTMEKQLVANAEVIERIDQFLREQVDDSAGLRIARILKGRRLSNDGTVPLTPADLKSLTREDSNEDSGEDSADETLVDDTETQQSNIPSKIERTIIRNTSKQQALQINAALGKDVWRNLERIVIRDNVAEDQSVQINYGTTIEVLLTILEQQEKRKIAARA